MTTAGAVRDPILPFSSRVFKFINTEQNIVMLKNDFFVHLGVIWSLYLQRTAQLCQLFSVLFASNCFTSHFRHYRFQICILNIFGCPEYSLSFLSKSTFFNRLQHRPKVFWLEQFYYKLQPKIDNFPQPFFFKWKTVSTIQYVFL